MAENSVDMDFFDKCALLAIQEILRSRAYHPLETDKIVLTAYAIANRAVEERESVLLKFRRNSKG